MDPSFARLAIKKMQSAYTGGAITQTGGRMHEDASVEAPFVEALMQDARTVALIGSGGKTTLLEELGHELAALHPDAEVALTTTTHLWPPKDVPLVAGASIEEAAAALKEAHLAYVGDRCIVKGEEKLCCPSFGIAALAEETGYLLIEADGSHMLPLKAHGAYEPVVPACADRTILVLGASGFGHPIRQVTHRPSLFAERAGSSAEDAATPERVARVVASELATGQIAPSALFVNQAEGSALDAASTFEAALGKLGCTLPVFAGSIHRAEIVRLS